MQYEILGTKILVRRYKKQTKTSKGIYLPEAHQKAPARGEILKVGPGRLLDNGTTIPLTVKPGQTVVFNEYSGQLLEEGDPVKSKDSDLVVLGDEDEIIAIVAEDK